MTNRYYTPTGNPVTLTRGASTQIRDEYTLVESALTEVETEMDAVQAGLVTLQLGTTATSTTSLLVGNGSKPLTVETGKGFVTGMSLRIASTASPSNYMLVLVDSYTSATGALETTAYDHLGAGTFGAWTISVESSADAGVANMVRSERAANTILGVADKGSLIVITGGTFTQTVDLAATLGNGWWCAYRNEGTGIVTITPTETIEGAASIRVYPKESIVLSTNATNFKATGRARIVLLGTSTVSGAVAAVDFETGFDDAEFDQIIIRGYKITHNGAVTRAPWARTKHAGAYVTTGTYDSRAVDVTSTGLAATGGAAVARFAIGATVAVGAAFNIEIRCTNLAAAGNGEHSVEWVSSQAGAAGFSRGAGSNSSGAALQGLRMLMAGDSITAGTFYTYGVRK